MSSVRCVERQMKMAALCLSLVGVLTGCSSADRPRSPDVPVPSSWTAAPASLGPISADWWHSLGGTNLATLIEEALDKNHDLKQAVARLDAAIAQAKMAGADLYPAVGLGFDAQRRQQVFVGLPIPGAGDRVLKSRSTILGVILNTSWELDLWGRIRNARRAALSDVQASEHELAAARHSLAAQVAKAWFATLEAHRQLQLARATAENYGLTSRQVRARYERGIRSPLDVRLASASESSANSLAALRESQLQSATRQLELLLGRYPAARLSGANGLPELREEVPVGLPSELLDRRPDLRAAERRFTATDLRTREAKAALFPRISLTASGGRSSADLEDLLSNQFNVWSIAANLTQPIFEGGRLRANVKLSQARARQAAESYATTLLNAFGEVEIALANEQLLRVRETELAQATQQSAAALRLAQDRYQSGLEGFVTLLEAQRRALDAESQLLAVHRQRLDNRVDLHLALGGGFVVQ